MGFMGIFALFLYSLSFITQAGTAFFSFLLAIKSPTRYKWGWLFLCLGLTLMLGRRISPIFSILETNHFNMTDAILSLPISASLLIGTIGIHKLMSQVNTENQLMSILSQLDPLTNCLSRTETLYQLSNEIKRSQRTKKPIAVLELDIDHFKLINDEHGHNIGDEVLHSLATYIRSLLRSNDHFGRVGGEEFIIILPDTDEQQAKIIAERIREQVERKVDYSQSSVKPIQLTISIGICIAEITGSITAINDFCKVLIKQADEAMYRAKNNGRNQVAF